MAMKKNLYGKNVFVTGASSGIGRACAVMFARNGCDVTGVSRNTEEKTEHFAGGGSLTLRKLDVTDEEATRKFIEELPQVDIAVLCAGMGVAGPAETAPSELTRKQMEVNYFGTLNAAQPCLTRMRAQGKGLLMVIGSIAGRVSIPMQSQYSASKYALEAFTDAVARETKDDGGYGSVLEKSVAKMAADEQNGRSPDSVAKVALALAARKNPPARVPVGLDYKALMVLLRVMPDRGKEFILRKLYLPK